MDIYLADTDPLKDQDRFERLLLQMRTYGLSLCLEMP